MVSTHSLGIMIAERIDTILCLTEFSSQMKVYYDIYYLANKFDFEGKVLTEVLKLVDTPLRLNSLNRL